jgi:hypothetical protein
MMKLPVLVGLFAACGGPSAEAPLTLRLGVNHVETEQALHAHQFCREAGQGRASHEVYPRCDRPAAELGDAWVAATFDGDKLVELRRWERYPDDEHAVERWNQMLAARAKISQPSDEALRHLRDQGLLPAGTRSVKAFRGEDGVVIGVYLLTPSPPEQANVLEQINYEK